MCKNENLKMTFAYCPDRYLFFLIISWQKLINWISKFLFKIRFYDTQCGYKLYKSTVAKKIFLKLKDHRFAHDVEIILIANFMKILIKEMPVDWVHKYHSKVNILKDVFIMFWDLLMIKKRFLNKI